MNIAKHYEFNSTLGNQYAGYSQKKHAKLPHIMHADYAMQEVQI